MHGQRRIVLAICLLCMLVSTATFGAGDPVAFSFVFVGCNRLDKTGADATGSTSTANAQRKGERAKLWPIHSHAEVLFTEAEAAPRTVAGVAVCALSGRTVTDQGTVSQTASN